MKGELSQGKDTSVKAEVLLLLSSPTAGNIDTRKKMAIRNGSWTFNTMVKTSLGAPASHVTLPGIMLSPAADGGFLLMCTMEDK